MFVGTKVGEILISQRHKLSPNVEVQEIFEYEVYREHKADERKTEDDISAGFKEFSEKYGLSAPASKQRGKARKQVVGGVTSDVLSQIQQSLTQAI